MTEISAGPDISSKTCPYCQTRIGQGARAVVCDACGMPHHAQCWEHNDGCTTFGCRHAPGSEPYEPEDTDYHDEMEIVLHYPDGRSVRDVQPAYARHNDINLTQGNQPYSTRTGFGSSGVMWGLIGVVLLVCLMAVAVYVTSARSRSYPPVMPEGQYGYGGRPSDADAAYVEAMRADPAVLASEFNRGLTLLGLGENAGDFKIDDLLESAKRGETRNLDEADWCFKVCIRAVSTMDSNTEIQPLGMKKPELDAKLHLYQALSAVLRTVAYDAAGQHDQDMLWSHIAWGYITVIKQSSYTSPEFSERVQTLERILNGLRRNEGR